MKKNLSKLCLIILLLPSFYSLSQKNKVVAKEVLNISFEQLKDKDFNELGSVEYLDYGVISPTEFKADLFIDRTNCSGDICVPKNVYGSEEPLNKEQDNNDNYLGLVLYKPGKSASERSYVTIPLGKEKNQVTLKKGLKYCVEFSVSLAESSKFSVNNIAALFSKDIPSSSGAIYNTSDRLIRSQGNKVYSGFYGWEKVCNIYTAKGDEKFITLGNFDKNEETTFISLKKPKDSEVETISHAYYYVDNVIITLIDKEEDCKCYNSIPPKIEDSFSNLIYSKTPELTDKMKAEDKISAHVSYFRFGKATFTENCKEAMNYVIEYMKINPTSIIKIQGHCDAKEVKLSDGVEEFSNVDRRILNEYFEMDNKRALAVEKYFIDQGIEKKRLITSSESSNIQSADILDDDEEEVKDAKNRRVNFILQK